MKKFFVVLLCAIMAVQSLGGAYASIYLPSALTAIEEEAFEGDSSVSGNITLPEKVSSIGAEAFKDTNVYSLITPAELKEVGSGILAGTDALYVVIKSAEVNLADGAMDDVAYLIAAPGSSALAWANNKGVNAYSTDQLVWADAFCYAVSEDSLTLLFAENNAFSGSITIPEQVKEMNVTAIGPYAFTRLSNVTEINVPEAAALPENPVNWPEAEIITYAPSECDHSNAVRQQNPANEGECGVWCPDCEQWTEEPQMHYNSCLTPGYCYYCKAELGDAYEVLHDWWIRDEERDNWVDRENGTHAIECFDCGEFFETGIHVVDCREEVWDTCEVCGAAVEGDAYEDFDVSHEFWLEDENRENWIITETEHARQCLACEQRFDEGNHGVDCQSDDTTHCSACGVEVDAENVDTWHDSWNDEEQCENWVQLENGQWALQCLKCGHIWEEHDCWVRCGNEGVCDQCGQKCDAEPQHDSWIRGEERPNCSVKEGDPSKHVYNCAVCGVFMEEGNHGISCEAEDKNHCSDCGAEVDANEAEEWHPIEDHKAVPSPDDSSMHGEYCPACKKVVYLDAHWAYCTTEEGVCADCGAECVIAEDRIWGHETDENSCEYQEGTDYHTVKCCKCGKLLQTAEKCYRFCWDATNACAPCGHEAENLVIWHSEWQEEPDAQWVANDEGACFLMCNKCKGTIEGPYTHRVGCNVEDDGTCERCGEPMPEDYEIEHATWNEETQALNFIPDENDAGYHFLACLDCGAKLDRAFHTVSCVADDKSHCQQCGADVDENVFVAHKLADGDGFFDATAETHTLNCAACGKEEVVSQHFVRCDAENICLDCGYEECTSGTVMHMGVNTNGWCEACNTRVWENDCEHNNSEWIENPANAEECICQCTDCGETLDGPYEHRVGCMVPMQHRGKCERCNVAMPEDYVIEHNYFWIEPTNDQHAQQCWDCGEVVNTGDHTYNDDGWCTVCDAYADCDHNSIGWTVNSENGNECGLWCEVCVRWIFLHEHRNGCKDEVNACERCNTSMDCEDQHNTWNSLAKNYWTVTEGGDECGEWCYDCNNWVNGPYRHFNWCQDQGKCDRCYTELGEDWEINHETWIEDEECHNWIITENGKWALQCLDCGHIWEEHDCWVRCGNEGVCDNCGNPCEAEPQHDTWNREENRVNCYAKEGDPTRHVYLCDGCGVVVEEALHGVGCIAEDQDVCSDCLEPVSGKAGEDYEIWHNDWNDEEQRRNWVFTENGQWALECVDCGHIWEEHDCWVRCGNEGVCDQCGQKCDAEPQHDSWIREEGRENCFVKEDDPTMHVYVCVGCGIDIEEGRHGASCAIENPTACEDCGAEFAEGAVAGEDYDIWHNCGGSWEETYVDFPDDANKHAHLCINCGEYFGVEDHYEEDCLNADGKCDACGMETGVSGIQHNVNYEQAVVVPGNPGYCGYACVKCGMMDNVQEHMSLCDTEANVCAACGTTAAELGVESLPVDHYANPSTMGNDENEHWYSCRKCGTEFRQAHQIHCSDMRCIYDGLETTNGHILHVIGCVDFKSNPVQVAGDESQHGWLCSNCGMYALTADHSYDDETGVCICGRTQSCDHASITTWTVNQENNSECGRWCSSCSQWLEGPMRHENSCKNEGYCFRCETALEGWEVEHNLAWNEDRDNEWVITEDGTQCGQYCLNCNAWLNGTPYNHRIGCMVPANHHGACERCGAAMPEDWQIEHNYFWIETENDQHAQQCWDCGEVVNTGDHTYNDDGWCTVCDAYVDCDHNSIGWTVNPDNDGECRRWCELCGWDEVREHRNGCKDEVNACERCGTSMDCEDQHNTWNKETKSEWTAVENTDQCIQRCFDCGEELEGPYRHFNWCQDTGKCDRCYTELGEDWGIDHHTWLEDEERDNWVDNGDGTHKKVCLECDAIVEEGRHGISCDAENKEVCSGCGVDVEPWAADEWHPIEDHSAVPSEEDPSMHGEYCPACEDIVYLDAHWAWCNTDAGKCSDCGAEWDITEDRIWGHETDETSCEYQDGTDYHTVVCCKCGKLLQTAEKCYRFCWDATGACVACGQELENLEVWHAEFGQEPEGEWIADTENGTCSFKCKCGEILEGPYEHRIGCTSEANGLCERCGATMPDGWEIEHNIKWNEERDNDWTVVDGHEGYCGVWCYDCEQWLHGPHEHRIGCMADDNGECERCGAAMPEGYVIEHNADWTETADDQHVRVCYDCGETVETGDHDYDENGWCNVCGAHETCDHYSILGNWTLVEEDHNECGVWCEVCERWIQRYEHRNTCKVDGNICDRCGIEMDREDEHNTWNALAENDWTVTEKGDECGKYCFDCDNWIEGPWSHFNWCQKTGECDRCYTELGEDWEINHETWLEGEERDNWVDNGDGTHKKVCLDCDAIVEEGEHGVDCNAEDKSVCSACRVELTGTPGTDYEIWHNSWDEENQRDNWIILENGKHAEKCVNCDHYWNENLHGASCTAENPTACEACGTEFVENAVAGKDYELWHDTWNEEKQSHQVVNPENEMEHIEVCQDCSEIVLKEEHGIGCWAEDKTVCTGCGADYNVENPNEWHDAHDEWDVYRVDPDDPSVHGNYCYECKDIVYTGPHFRMCDGGNTCAACGVAYSGLNVEHDVGDAKAEPLPYNSDYCGIQCPDCNEWVYVYRHCVMCNADNESKNVCTNCGVAAENLYADHYYGSEGFSFTDTEHTYSCRECGESFTEVHFVFCSSPTQCVYGCHVTDEVTKIVISESWQTWHKILKDAELVKIDEEQHGILCSTCGEYCLEAAHSYDESGVCACGAEQTAQ